MKAFTQVNIQFSTDAADTLHTIAKREGVSTNDVIRAALLHCYGVEAPEGIQARVEETAKSIGRKATLESLIKFAEPQNAFPDKQEDKK